ncbi:nucleotidyltransferase family protein [Vibrio sp. D420a]|uniref:nucleotidyltransferase family protein n=1 Tax=Vibrio sp. D420a TaxID=2836895 RepID=UPI0025549C5B|nr:nucleotidyltransferase family protein [Vibrio sp. D420a]MDK9762810.1 nucleotidyltransferase family protein [Vibrio sp. D420a]
MKHTFLLKDESTLHDAIDALDRGGIGLLAFVDCKGTFLGILTDGDLRRGILNKTESLHEMINSTPLVMDHQAEKRDIVAKLRSVHRRHMPLVDEHGVLKTIFSLSDIEFVSKENTVVIMAGGLGSRLGELTKETPKPMLHVGKKPMLQHIVEQFRDQGFHRFIFCLNYKREVITDFFGDGSEFGVVVDYVFEEQRLGTAGALSLIESNLDSPFFVINGDVLTNMDFNSFLDFHIENESTASMCVRQFQKQVPYGVINTNEYGQILSLDEKPCINFHVNAGIYLLNPSLIKFVPKGEFYDMPSLFELMIENDKKTCAYQIHDYWLDIGQRDDYIKANEDIKEI